MAEHVHTLRVRYGESDQMGIAHHAVYVLWLEEARIAWLRAHGVSYRELEASGVLMPVIEITVRYRKSVRFDDELELRTTAVAAGPSRVVFTTAISHAGALCVEGTVTVAAVTSAGRPTRIPAELLPMLISSKPQA